MAAQRNPKSQRRIHPKLRMMLNSDPPVNAGRAETTGCLCVTPTLARTAMPLQSGIAASAVEGQPVNVQNLNAQAPSRSDVSVNIFVQTTAPTKLARERARVGNLAMLRVSLDEVVALAKQPKVAFVEHAENLKRPGPIRSATGTVKPPERSINTRSDWHHDGRGILIGIIDVEGFDWMHTDFDDGTGRSRFISIWDQGRLTGPKPKGFDYGVELTPDRMQKARSDAPGVGVSPHDLEPQSEMVPGSHGTHVASIAAGNTGICSKADIAAVLVSLSEKDLNRRTSFYDSTRLIDAVNYLLAIADARKQPISINISLGTNGHAHDGSGTLDRWLDALIAKPGRSICVAAGNAGQERADKPGDLGYILGRIHTSGRIAARGLDHDIEWIVAGDAIVDVSENELEFWYEPQDRIAVSIKPPNGDWIGPIQPGEYIQNMQLSKKAMLSIYNERYHPANGHNYISIYLTPYISNAVIVGIPSGIWTVRLHGIDIRDGRFHGWIERDDPQTLLTGQHYWPSFFSARSNVDACSVSSLACGARIVSVANLDELQARISMTSSQGPTRDGRLKPDVAARGTDVVAANGFGASDQAWIGMTGTSMASPFVAGVVGLMLAAQPNLSAAQINGILKATARPLPGGTYEWVNDCGFGVVNPIAAVEQARLAQVQADVKGRFE